MVLRPNWADADSAACGILQLDAFAMQLTGCMAKPAAGLNALPSTIMDVFRNSAVDRAA